MASARASSTISRRASSFVTVADRLALIMTSPDQRSLTRSGRQVFHAVDHQLTSRIWEATMADDLFANGIFADTGRPLPLPEDGAVGRIAVEGTPKEEHVFAKARAGGPASFGL